MKYFIQKNSARADSIDARFGASTGRSSKIAEGQCPSEWRP